ncbi:MAG: DUF11 domain-containing protein [Caldilinea sp. CFX5]|nr:DUF11 domain-containing protein [Caldilinea sp. CFX5]
MFPNLKLSTLLPNAILLPKWPFIRHGRLAFLLALLLLALPRTVLAQTTPANNPDLTPRCGLDVILVLDESASLTDYAATVRTSVRSLLAGLADTGAQVALIEFNMEARQPIGAGYHPITSTGLAAGGVFDRYLNNNYQPNGYTNWEAAFAQVENINRDHGVAPLVIFFTDSGPNVYTNQFGTVVGGNEAVALDEAVQAANRVKAQGSHIFVVGVGDVTAEARIVAISGPDQHPQQRLPFGQSDYTLTVFAELEQSLSQIVFNLCAPAVVVTKYINTGNGAGYTPLPGHPFAGAVAIAQNGQPATAFEWMAPVTGPATQQGQSQSLVTDGGGRARWQWLPGAPAAPQPWPSRFTLAETLQPGDIFVEALCTRRTLGSNGLYTINNFTLTTLPATVDIGPADLLLCDVRNSRLGLAVEKTANPTTLPESGGNVVFTFQVINNGGAPVALQSLVDSAFGNLHGQGDCVADGAVTIAAGADYRCTITKFLSGNAGTPHVNTVTATVRSAQNVTVSRTDSATVTFSDVAPTLTFTRDAAPTSLHEPGGPVVYGVQFSNNNPGEALTITTLSDNRYGNITTVGGAVSATTCATPIVLAPAGAPNAAYSCHFTAQVSGPPGPVIDTLSATVNDDDGNTVTMSRDQLVTILNVPPQGVLAVTVTPASRPEPGGIFTFQLAVTNTNPAETLNLTALTNSVYGNLEQTGGAVTATDCTTPHLLAPAGQPAATYRCTVSVQVTGGPALYPSTVQATIADDDGGELTLAQGAVVEITDLLSSILVTKRANPTSLPEPGGNVTFTVTVENSSLLDQVRIDQITDDHFGDLRTACAPALPAWLPPQGEIQCQFVRPITGAVGFYHANTVTAVGVDDDGIAVRDSDLAIVGITDLPSLLEITQSAQPANLPEPGGPVTFTVVIRNKSAVDVVTVTKVEANAAPSVTGATRQAPALLDISAHCQPPLPVALAPGAQIVCVFTKVINGPVDARHINEVTVTGQDDEALPLTERSREAIDIVDQPAGLRVTTSPHPVSVPEAGAIVNFTVLIENISAVDDVTVQSLDNSLFGAVGASCTPALPVRLSPRGALTCQFSRFVKDDIGAILNPTTTVRGIDDDGKAVSDDAQSGIGIVDTPSSIKIVQTTLPTSLAEPGGPVTFTIAVENSSAVDAVTINTVQDSRFGDVSSSCLPALPATLAPQATLLCRFTRTLTGAAGDTFASTVTVAGVDDDGQPVTDFDLGNLDITDAIPQLTVAMTASPNRILATGGPVTFTVALVNNGPEPLTVEQLLDAQGGSLQGRGSCRLPQTLPANGGGYQCSFTELVTGAANGNYQALVTAVVSDDDGNRVQVVDEADLFLVAVEPKLVLTKRDRLVNDTFTNEQDRGKPSPGDTLGYEIVVRNTGNGSATDVVLTDVPDANTTLVVGSVRSDRGSVVSGNAGNDWLVVIDLGNLASGEEATLTFEVIITEGAGATLLRNQATLSQGISGAMMAGSDDPDTPFFGDPTDTIVFLPPTGLLPGEEPLRQAFLPLIKR